MSKVLIKENPAIKLFGKTIPLPPDKHVSDVITVHDSLERRQNSSSTSTSRDSKDASGGEIMGSKHEDDSMNTKETLTEPATSSGISYHSKTTNSEKNKLNESISAQENILKKPDKILPCTRCNSMDTKFCYYNNYNVSQPRHFCKNCQRYWTDGGTMRNVPVGSGRRRNKNVSVPYFRHIMSSDAVNGICFPSLKPNGFFVFGLDRPLCESMNSTLNLAERSESCVYNEFYGHSSRSSSANSNSNEKGSHENVQELGLEKFWDKSSLSHCFSQLSSGFPVTLYSSAPDWDCAFPTPWNVPCVTATSSSSCQLALSSSPASNLGKHLREGTMIRPLNSGKENLSKKTSVDSAVLISKSLRIDDPKEAAKSSTWWTAGVKKEKIDPLCGTRLFKAFESKRDRSRRDNIDTTTTTTVLQANPAALSRSLNFHERHGFVIPKHS